MYVPQEIRYPRAEFLTVAYASYAKQIVIIHACVMKLLSGQSLQPHAHMIRNKIRYFSVYNVLELRGLGTRKALTFVLSAVRTYGTRTGFTLLAQHQVLLACVRVFKTWSSLNKVKTQ